MSYPDNNYGYQVFRINAGKQVLDGKTALKYVRSRHSTSDFDPSIHSHLHPKFRTSMTRLRNMCGRISMSAILGFSRYVQKIFLVMQSMLRISMSHVMDSIWHVRLVDSSILLIVI